jgi:hypothetical protein
MTLERKSMERTNQLDELIEALSKLTEMLTLDSSCQWRRHFEHCLVNARELRSNGFEQSNLNELSGSIRYVYGGMGSFNDYAPIAADETGSFSVIGGMEGMDVIANHVYERALNLMVTAG